MIFFLQIQIYFSQKLYIVLKVTTAYFNNLIGILVHVGKSSNIVTHFDTVNYRYKYLNGLYLNEIKYMKFENKFNTTCVFCQPQPDYKISSQSKT
jgi:bisphosphoglycerate-dependent phosphoglycerate mutase